MFKYVQSATHLQLRSAREKQRNLLNLLQTMDYEVMGRRSSCRHLGCGLVFDICVKSSALHGAEMGFRVSVYWLILAALHSEVSRILKVEARNGKAPDITDIT